METPPRVGVAGAQRGEGGGQRHRQQHQGQPGQQRGRASHLGRQRRQRDDAGAEHRADGQGGALRDREQAVAEGTLGSDGQAWLWCRLDHQSPISANLTWANLTCAWTFRSPSPASTDLGSQIYRQLRDAILDGRLRDGERLPATRELARDLAVSATRSPQRTTG